MAIPAVPLPTALRYAKYTCCKVKVLENLELLKVSKYVTGFDKTQLPHTIIIDYLEMPISIIECIIAQEWMELHLCNSPQLYSYTRCFCGHNLQWHAS